jgi:hypothetical protein
MCYNKLVSKARKKWLQLSAGMLSTMSRCADYFRNFQNGHGCHGNHKKHEKFKVLGIGWNFPEIFPPPCVIGFPVTQACALISLNPVTLQESYYKILVTVQMSPKWAIEVLVVWMKNSVRT